MCNLPFFLWINWLTDWSPKLESDITVVSDRFTDATYAYQHGGKGIDLKTIDLLKRLIQNELEPDLTFLFDLPVNVSIQRLKKTREMDKFEIENEAFHQSIRSTYLDIAKKNKDRFHIIDSTQEIVDIQKEIRDVLDRFFWWITTYGITKSMKDC